MALYDSLSITVCSFRLTYIYIPLHQNHNNQIYERRHKLATQALGRWNDAVVVAAEAAAEEQQQQQQAAVAGGGDDDGDKNGEQQQQEEEDAPWDPSRDPLPPTLDVSVACGDVVEEGAEGFQVLLLVSAAFTDALLQTVARALGPLPVGTVVRVAFLRLRSVWRRGCGIRIFPFPSVFLIYQNKNETHTHRPSASPRASPVPSGRCCTTRRARSRGAAPASSSSGKSSCE